MFLPLPAPWETLPGIRAFFTTRQGGVSQGPYADFNPASHVGDNPRHVTANLEILAAALELPLNALLLAEQVHGRRTVVAEGPAAGPRPEADAWASRTEGLALCVMTADCAPVLFADATNRVIGAAHAGWRGAMDGALDSCLDAMAGLGADPERILALIGPCIRRKAYKVDPPFKIPFLAEDQSTGRFFTPSPRDEGKLLFDLPGYVASRLHGYGLNPDNVIDTGHCTHADEEIFFSHRRATQRSEAPCGRLLGGLLLIPSP